MVPSALKPFDIFDAIYCVSLPECTERRISADSEFKKIGLSNFSFFDAIGKEGERVEKAFASGFVKKFPPCFRCGKDSCNCENNFLVKAQVANFLTYSELWKDIITKQHKFCMIVEDDISFTDYAVDLAAKVFNESFLREQGINFEAELLIRLGWAKCEDHQSGGEIKFVPNLLKMSNPCHAITNKMAAKLLSSLERIATTSDIYIHEIIGMAVPNYTLLPPLAYEKSWSTAEFQSLIHPKSAHIELLKRNKSTPDELLEKAESECEKHIQKKIVRDLLVAGHPRCGTGYMSKLLNYFELDVGHESVGKNGISSWMFAVYDWKNPFALNNYATSRYYCSFRFVVHHVRNPLKAIPSIVRENRESKPSFEFRAKHIQQQFGVDLRESNDELTMAILSYLLWNRIIKESGPALVVRVEDCEKQLFSFCRSNGLIKRNPLSILRRLISHLPNKKVNKGKLYSGISVGKPIIKVSDWNGIAQSLKKELNQFCNEYGYTKLFDEKYDFIEPIPS